MTKEEAIQKAWIDVFGDKKINQIITYANKLTGFLEGFMLRNFKLDINNEKLEKKFNGVVYSYRPKSLQGIEDNNGWIRIESEHDFPKNSTYMETILNYYEINDPRAQGMHHFILGDEKFLLEIISHYRVIPFNPPIY